ncbi:reverse transcriptase domain-containing protein [Tanacetum coccineum]
MTLELADISITHPIGFAEDDFIKVVKFHFPADFVVVDYDADPWVPLILGRPFLRTARALIDVYGEEITLRFNDEAITFKVGQTSRYSYNNSESVNQIDVIDISCEEYAQEVLGFSDSSKSGGDFILEEIEACLTNDSISSGIDDANFDPEGDLLLLEKLLNDDPSSPLPPKQLHFEELKTIKSSIDDPPKLELKDLPSHLEYAFLEGTDKLPIIISKELKDEEKAALLKVLKSHKRAIAWKISDIKVVKLLDAGLIYPISDSPWVSPVHCVPKKGGMTIVENEDNELIPTRLVTGWRVCIDYRKLNDATRKDHFSFSFMHQMLERLAGNEYYCFLDGFSGYFQIPIDPKDQDKTTFTCPYAMFAYRRMPFGSCNAPGTFQRCMMAILHDIVEEPMEVFMDDFSFFGDSFSSCLSHVDKMLKWCEDTNLVLNWEKCHFMVKEGIVLGHKISKSGIEVDKAKLDVIAKLPHPTSVKILGKRKTKHFQPIHYASKTMTDAQADYTTTEKELLAVVYALEKFRPYLVLSKTIVYTDHSALKNLLAKQDAKPRLENPHQGDLEKKEINETFPLETLGMISFRGDSSTPWFADIANYHARNFIIKGMSSQQKINSLRMLSIIFGMTPTCLGFVWIKLLDDVFTAKNPLISLWLAIMDPPGDIMVPTTPLRKSSIPVFIGQQFTVMPTTWTVGENHASWSGKLDDALWAFCTTFKTPIGCTPYKIVYIKACHLPIELEHKAYWALKHCNFDLKTAGDHRKDCPDYEDSRARGFVHRPLDLQSFACLYMVSNIQQEDKNKGKMDKAEHGFEKNMKN